MSKKLLLILILVAIAIIAAVLFLKHKQVPVSPGTTNIPQGSLTTGHELYVTPAGQQAIDRGNVVSTMLDSMPENGYQGTYFNLNFSFKTGLYTLTLQSAYQQQGQQEFDLFLRAHGIDDRSWLDPNLRVVVQ